MKKSAKKLWALLLAAVMLFQSAVIVSFASGGSSWFFNSQSAAGRLGTQKLVEEYIRGDVDSSGEINSVDVNLLKRYMLGSLPAAVAPDILITGDADADKVVNPTDLNILKRVLIGNITANRHQVFEDSTADYDKTMDSALITVDRDVNEGIYATVALADGETLGAYAVITYMLPSGKAGNSSLAVSGAIGTDVESAPISYIADGYFHSAVVDLSKFTSIDGADEMVLTYFDSAKTGDRIYIDSIYFCADSVSAGAVATQRTEAKNSFYSNDLGHEGVPVLGSVDSFGSKIIRFDSQKKVDRYVSLYKNTAYSYSPEENALQLTATSVSDPGVYMDLTNEEIEAGSFEKMIVVYKVPTSAKLRQLKQKIYFLCNGATTITSSCGLTAASLTKEDSYNIVEYKIPANITDYSGQLTGLRFDYFETATSGSQCFIEAIIFGGENTKFSYEHILRDKNGEGSLHVSAPWIEYWTLHSNANDYEYVTGSGADIEMNFRYSSLEALSSESLGGRMARAVSEATGYNVQCSIYGGVSALEAKWANATPSAKIYYNFEFEGTTYIVYIPTNIIKDPSFTDVLDGNASQTDPSYNRSENWSVDGITVSDAKPLPVSHSSIASHSNHEARLVETPYGTFAVIPMEDNGASWGSLGVTANVYKIEDDGTYRSVYTFECANHSSKPNIFYAADGLVYVLVGDAVGNDYVSAFVAYFDPASPNGDGTYNVTSSRTNLTTGVVAGGWGYTQPILNDTLGIFTLMCCGGSGDGYFAWANYDYVNHKWLSGVYTKQLETNRHCYLYGFSDGGEGMYVVGGRDVLLSTLGLAGTVYGADYAWDEVNLFHFPNVAETNYERYTVSAADYTQMYASIFPVTSNNFHGDTYISSDGYMHVLTSTCMHGNFHHDVKYWEMWYTVYDVREAGAEPKLVYHKPISFGDGKNEYVDRMIEGADGRLYYVAMKSGTNVCEIWRQKEGSYEFEMVANKIFEGSGGVTTAMIVTNSRNGSVNDNTISIMYPTDAGGGVTYRFFTVDLGE